MKSLLLAPLALFLFTPNAEEVGTSYSEGQSIRVVSRSETTMELLSTTISFDGEEMPDHGETQASQVETNTMEYVDRIVSVDDGRTTVIERSFEEIEQEEDSGDEQTSSTGILSGRTIRIEEDEEGDVVVSIADEDGNVDDLYLEGFTLLYDEELLLPEDEVDVGDSWTVEGETARRYFGLVNGVTWFEDDDEDDGGPDFESLFSDELDGEVSVTFLGQEQYEGQAVWAFEFELSMDGSVEGLSADEVGMGGGDENPLGSGEVALTAYLSGEGRFLVGCESSCLVASNGKGQVDLDMSISADLGGHILLAELVMLIHLEGETSYEVE